MLTFLTGGNKSLTARYTSDGNYATSVDSKAQAVTSCAPIPPGAELYVKRLNAGGMGYVDGQGVVWEADVAYVPCDQPYGYVFGAVYSKINFIFAQS